ncbi:MAG TPA: hypothetical protein VKB02_18360 [Pyrinomonadaceae bacterium]|nr:hypothetical protein [Pyrinomonadaceae bacterium]
MKLLNHSIKARIFWLLASFIAMLIASPLPQLRAQNGRDETHNVTRWEHTDTDIKLRRRLEVSGKAEFTDDYTDIKNVSEGGWVIVEEHRDRQSYRYEVRHDASGQLQRLFYVNGVAQPIDANGKAWLAKFVLDAVRQGGFDAENRVKTILGRRGVSGVLAEIDQISGDWAKRVYYEHLLKHANLDAATLRDVLRQMARNISSDYEQAQLLTAVAPRMTGKDAALQPFFDAVATINSDYERSRVLKTIMKQDAASSALLVLVASATKTISSDYERRGVLSALVKAKNQSEEVLRLLLDSAAAMSSDYEKATLLLEVSNVYTGDTRLKSEFLKAVETIKSDYERGRVLSALLKNKQIG